SWRAWRTSRSHREEMGVSCRQAALEQVSRQDDAWPRLYFLFSSLLAFSDTERKDGAPAPPFTTSELLNSPQRLLHPIRRHRGLPQAHASEFRDRIGDRRGDQRGRHLADAGWMVVGRHHLDEHLRHLVQARHVIVVEVRLLDRAVIDRDPLEEREPEP